MSFDGQTVVITGGSSGIGLALATMVVERGGRVVLVGRTPEKLERAAANLGPSLGTRCICVSAPSAFVALAPRASPVRFSRPQPRDKAVRPVDGDVALHKSVVQ
jgi:NAD(P)-dependent dehydrogenase (short-subunit alcohol dehydrogenase family)